MPLRRVALGLRLALEVLALVALGAWGYRSSDWTMARLVLTLALPLLAALAWATFVSPKARVPVPPAARLFVELLVFGAATVALAGAGWEGPAVLYGLAVALQYVLLSGVRARGDEPRQR